MEHNNYIISKIIGIVILLLCLSTAASAIDVNAPATLSVDGGLYNVTTNFTCTATCITIGANNLTLDLMGYTLTFANVSTGSGILNSGYDNVTVKNGSIIPGNTSITHTKCIYWNSNANYGNITNISSFVYNVDIKGIYLDTANYNTITSNNINITLGHPLYLFGSGYNTFRSNIFSSTLTMGIDTAYSDYNILTSNTVSSNSDWGIHMSYSDYNILTSNTVSSNLTSGLALTNSYNTILTSNIFSSNTNYPIYLSANTNTTFISTTVTSPIGKYFYIEIATYITNIQNTLHNFNISSSGIFNVNISNVPGKMFNNSIPSIPVTNTPTSSYSNITTNATVIRTITVLDATLTPASGIVNTTIFAWNTTYMKWNGTSDTNAITAYAFWNLYANESYTLKYDGVYNQTVNTDANGNTSWTYPEDSTSHLFELEFIPTFYISGYTKNGIILLPGVNVSTTNGSSISDANGFYTVYWHTAGTYTVTASKANYNTNVSSVSITANTSYNISIGAPYHAESDWNVPGFNLWGGNINLLHNEVWNGSIYALNLTIPITKPSSPTSGNLFENQTTHALNWFDGGLWYYANGTLLDDSPSSSANKSIGWAFGGDGTVITAPDNYSIVIPSAGTIKGLTVISDQLTTATFTVTKASWPAGGAVPTYSDITGGNPVTLTSAGSLADSTLTGWTKTLAYHDVLFVNVASNDLATSLSLQVEYS